ncbi:MAG: response regulator [Acidimicrobiales bacterium]
MKLLLVVEDDDDITMLLRVWLSRDHQLVLDGQATDITGAVVEAQRAPPDLIVLDHRLAGPVTGIEGAAMLKQVAPMAKIVLFSASEEVRGAALAEPAIDAFVLKTRIDELLPTCRRLLGLDAVPSEI